ncbi:MAG: hypothetical protein KGR24_02910, partial [Planctomycetes bacterium]|nr:hypothetical protein [Planctomycetota bacterium]
MVVEIDWIVTNDIVVRPDIVFVCGPAPRQHVEQPPAFVAEILKDRAEGGGAGERLDDLPRVVGRAVVGDDEFERTFDPLLTRDRLEHEREMTRLLKRIDDQGGLRCRQRHRDPPACGNGLASRIAR